MSSGVLVTVPGLGIDLVTAVAFLLLVAAVVAAVLPSVPAALLSISGVLLYWWGTGYTEPGTVLLVALLSTGILAVLADWFGGVVAAGVGGASRISALAGGLVGFVLLFVAGPIGVLAGAAGTVFTVEYIKQRDARAGAVAAGGYLLGFFASALVQALLALSILVAVAVVALS